MQGECWNFWMELARVKRCEMIWQVWVLFDLIWGVLQSDMSKTPDIQRDRVRMISSVKPPSALWCTLPLFMSVLIHFWMLFFTLSRYVVSLLTECTTCWATCTSMLAVSPSSVLTAPVSSTWRGTSAGTWRSNTEWTSHQKDKVSFTIVKVACRQI